MVEILTNIWSFVASRAPGAGLIIVGALAMVYVAIHGVALFHPDPERRADARAMLPQHRFSRKPKNENS